MEFKDYNIQKDINIIDKRLRAFEAESAYASMDQANAIANLLSAKAKLIAVEISLISLEVALKNMESDSDNVGPSY